MRDTICVESVGMCRDNPGSAGLRIEVPVRLTSSGNTKTTGMISGVPDVLRTGYGSKDECFGGCAVRGPNRRRTLGD